MNTTLLIKINPNQEQLNEIFANHKDINYIFFYADAVQAVHQQWQQNQTFNICRTALLRRQLIKEATELDKPWIINSLYDFYQRLSKSETLLILDKKGLTIKTIKQNQEPKLLFVLENLKEIKEPEELIEFIIGASLSFKVHAYLKDEIITHPWDKHLNALSHYDIEIDTQQDEDKFDLIINYC